MNGQVEITKDIYWVGVKDSSDQLFENLWPLDKGVTYNSFLCVDDKITLVDCVENDKVEELLRKKNDILPAQKPIDYLVINHIEPDHSGGIIKLINAFPNIKIVGNKATFKFLEGYYQIHSNLYEVKNNTILTTGNHTFRFITTPMLHWPETMMTFHEPSRILFSGDAFGSFGATSEIFDNQPFELLKDEFVRYFANVLGKYHKNILKALAKIEPLKPSMIASTHGPIWKQHLDEVIALYYKFSQHLSEPNVLILYGTMYGNTEKLILHMNDIISKKGINTTVLDASHTHVSYILAKAFICKGIIIGAPTYNGEIFPWVDFALQMIARFEVMHRYYGIFGSKTWSTGVTRKITERVDKLAWQLVHDPFENLCAPTENDYQMAEKIALKMIDSISD